MSLFVASLNSGSNGNCYYIGTRDEAVLVDGGISCRETEKRMKRLGLSIKKVKAVIVSHEHGDHTHGVTTLSKKFGLPVYITPRTYQNGNLRLTDAAIRSFQPLNPFVVGSLIIKAFPKLHDAVDAHSFIISHEDVNVGVFTDIGTPCEHVIRHFKECHAAFLEANYDEVMLENGGYPRALKSRIRGGMGHLSNRQAVQLFKAHRPSFMTHLFLAHLSRNNNSPAIVKDLFFPIAGNTEIIIASRSRETKLYHIQNIVTTTRAPIKFIQQQLSLFQ